MLKPLIGMKVDMGKYGEWVLVDQLSETYWPAKRSDGECAVIIFQPDFEPGFAPPKPSKLTK